ncbi:helix-turn-helix domain-containing protein [candidate division KSB1 bacterium]
MASLGSEFRAERKKKRLNIKSIAQKTRINYVYLENIENDIFDFLHEPYVKGFVLSYARELGMDVNYVREKYEQYIKEKLAVIEEDEIITKERPRHSETSEFKIKRVPLDYDKITQKRKKNFILVISIVLFIAVIFTLKNFLNQQEQADPGTEKGNIPLNRTEISSIDSSEYQPEKTTPDILKLRLVAREQLWFRVIIDDIDTSEYMFSGNEIRDWTAQNKFEIRSGKATGFDLFFNDRQLENLGTEDRMIGRLVLTKDGIEHLFNPVRPVTDVIDTSAVSIY